MASWERLTILEPVGVHNYTRVEIQARQWRRYPEEQLIMAKKKKKKSPMKKVILTKVRKLKGHLEDAHAAIKKKAESTATRISQMQKHQQQERDHFRAQERATLERLIGTGKVKIVPHESATEVTVSAHRKPDSVMPPDIDYAIKGKVMGQMLNEKQRQYGSSFFKVGEFLTLLYPDGIHPEDFVFALALVRIFDKMNRIASPNRDLDTEDPFSDITGYGLLGSEAWKRERLQHADEEVHDDCDSPTCSCKSTVCVDCGHDSGRCLC